MSVFFVTPETVRRNLVFVDTDGQSYPFWVNLKKHLTVGEQRRVMTAGWRGVSSGPEGHEIGIDWKVQTFARSEAYLTGWSLTNDAGEPTKPTRDRIEALAQGVYEVIEAAITDHIAAVEQEKKVPTGSAEPSATST